jgi:hypothetical protein
VSNELEDGLVRTWGLGEVGLFMVLYLIPPSHLITGYGKGKGEKNKSCFSSLHRSLVSRYGKEYTLELYICLGVPEIPCIKISR